jgi:hypothetical protein
MPHVRICGGGDQRWSFLLRLIFLALGSSSVVSWMALMMSAIIPPVVLLCLWNDGPPPTIAEVLRATEDRR